MYLAILSAIHLTRDGAVKKDGKTESLISRTRYLLENAIKNGNLNPGRVIVVSTLAELTGTSRSPIKAAIAALHAKGLLVKYEGRGFIVRPQGSPVDRRPITAESLDLKPSETGAFKISSWEKLYSIVEPDLVRCAIRGDLKVNESDAASFYGVGRTVMHEVLLLAQANGLVIRDERSRWRTVTLNDERISDLYELRTLLEPKALASAASFIPEGELDRLMSDLQHAIEAYPNVRPDVLYRMEEELHIQCVEQCPNQEIIEALRRTKCIHLASRYLLGNEVTLPKLEPFFAEHASIVDAIRKRQHSKILRETKIHLEAALPKVIARVQSAREALLPTDLPYVTGIGTTPKGSA